MSKANPRVSVIIPVYNGERFVAEAISSVLAQDYTDFELIVVNDGSTDNTLSVLKKFGTKLKIINLPHKGVSRARNAGIQASKGEFIASNDSDDLWEPTKLNRQVAYMDAHPDVGLVYSYSTNFTGKSEGAVALVKKVDFEGHIFKDLVTKNSFASPTALYRKAAYDKVGPYDESLQAMEDYEFNLRFSREYKIGRIPHSLLRRRIHPHSFYSSGYDNQYTYQLPVYERLLDNQEIARALETTKKAFMSSFILKFIYRDLYEGRQELIKDKLATLKEYSPTLTLWASFLSRWKIKTPMAWQPFIPEFASWSADVRHKAALFAARKHQKAQETV